MQTYSIYSADEIAPNRDKTRGYYAKQKAIAKRNQRQNKQRVYDSFLTEN